MCVCVCVCEREKEIHTYRRFYMQRINLAVAASEDRMCGWVDGVGTEV